jgi:Adenylyl/Guanylyl and SMODS C-terminal sensor domain/Second Messenger Oligonucleotide or Dinucleotide Synthetase domain
VSVDVSIQFQQFLDNIALGQRQIERMTSAANTVAAFVTESYGLPPGGVFLQGSYPNGTAIEPVEGGEYDVDLVAVCASGGVGPTDALNDLEQRFAADGRFRDRIKRKNPCVRLEYAPDDVGKFHVDVVPVRASNMAPLEAPRRNEGWKGTAPAEYTAWCTNQGQLFMRTVQTLKRWRSEQQSVRTAIKSIVLQVLVWGAMSQIGDDAARVAGTFRALHNQLAGLQSPPAVWNPVLQSENLAATWSDESFKSFVAELAEAVALVDQAMNAEDVVEALDAWRELLGDDFPTLTSNALGIQLGDYAHAQTPADIGWTEQLDGRFKVTIQATRQRGKAGRNVRDLPNNGDLVFAGSKLRFKAHTTEPVHSEVWWQVANTGGHARAKGGLRGGIFKAKAIGGDESPSETDNWESTAYTGRHLIRALLVRSQNVVAVSDWFQVNIYAKRVPFSL